MFAYLRRRQQFGRIILDIAVGHQITVEGTHTTEDASLRAGNDAFVVKTCREVLQIFQLHIHQCHIVLAGIFYEIFQVVAICLKRIIRIVSLQLEVSHIIPDDFICHFLI